MCISAIFAGVTLSRGTFHPGSHACSRLELWAGATLWKECHSGTILNRTVHSVKSLKEWNISKP